MTSESMLRACPLATPMIWNELNETDNFATKTARMDLSPSAILEGKEIFSIKDELKFDSPLLGGDGMGMYMADAFFPEDDSSIVTSSCHFSLDKVDPEETSPSVFGGDFVDGKADYNSWDKFCFGNLEEVDSLLSSDPDSTFRQLDTCPGSLQWNDPTSHLELQPDSELPDVCSPPINDSGPGVKEKVDVSEVEVSVPNDIPLPLPYARKVQEVAVEEHGLQYATSSDNHLLCAHERAEQQCNLQAGSHFNKSGPLVDEKMSQGITESMPGSESTVNLSAGKVTEDESGPSSIGEVGSEKFRTAQNPRTQRRALKRKIIEERNKRELNHRKILHGGPQGPQMISPIPVLIPQQTGQLHQSSTPTLQGFVGHPSILFPLQTMIRPAPLYLHVGYSPSVQLIPQVAPCSVPPQVHGQGLHVGFQQPCAFPQALPSYQQYQLRPSGEVQVSPHSSTPTMTPQEKIKKLRFLQQMQARLAVKQQQQCVDQGIAALDGSGLREGFSSVPQSLAFNQRDAGVNGSEKKMTISDSDFEPSFSVGQSSVDSIPDDEGGSVEAAVLDDLQNTIKTMKVGSRLCIRDGLYRLARSAIRRQSSGGLTNGDHAAKSSQVTEDADATSTGQEAISTDPSASSRVSGMDRNMVETQTNPFDRTIAHLLFHKRQSLPLNIQVAPSVCDDTSLGPSPTSLAKGVDAANAEGTLPEGELAAALVKPILVGVVAQGIFTGADRGSALSLPPPRALSPIPALSLQDQAGLRSTGTREQTGELPSNMKENSRCGQVQGNAAEAGVLIGDFPSPIGLQSRAGTETEQHDVKPTHRVISSAEKNLNKMKNAPQRKRLQHATGLRELTQILDAGQAPVRSEETLSGPPLSTSSSSDECQASGFPERANQFGDEATAKRITKQEKHAKEANVTARIVKQEAVE